MVSFNFLTPTTSFWLTLPLWFGEEVHAVTAQLLLCGNSRCLTQTFTLEFSLFCQAASHVLHLSNKVFCVQSPPQAIKRFTTKLFLTHGVQQLHVASYVEVQFILFFSLRSGSERLVLLSSRTG